MARFIAIPVTIGDAFYLERDGRSILVDGGKSESAFPALFHYHVNRSGVDIIVCTHNDADHANGIIGFLEAALTCGEIWLPGAWLSTVEDLMRPDVEVFEDIVNGAFEFWDINKGAADKAARTIEEAGTNIFEAGFESETREGETKTDNINLTESFRFPSESWGDVAPRDWPEDVADAIEQTEYSELPDAWYRLVSRYFGRYFDPPSESRLWNIIRGAIEAGERIKRIARLAYLNGIPVRWFQHDPQHASGGIPGFLYVISARQVVRVYPYSNLTLFARLALTTVNKESLVLYSPSDEHSPGVLFCADSDLEGTQIPVRPRDLITVPHHGAQANDGVYNAIESAIGEDMKTLTWVRSDSRVKKRPCPAYCGLPGRKFCTICRTGLPKQRVGLFSRSGSWVRQGKVRPCVC